MQILKMEYFLAKLYMQNINLNAQQRISWIRWIFNSTKGEGSTSTALYCCMMQCSAVQHGAVQVQWMNWQGRLGQAGTSKAVTAGRKKGSRPIPGKQVSTQSLVTNILFSKHSSPLSPPSPRNKWLTWSHKIVKPSLSVYSSFLSPSLPVKWEGIYSFSSVIMVQFCHELTIQCHIQFCTVYFVQFPACFDFLFHKV